MFYSFAKCIVKFLSYIFYPYEVIGDINKMPKEDGVLICANHISYLDAVFLGLISDRQIRFIAKEKYANMPILKPIFKALGSFGVDPEKADITAIRNCFSVIKKKEVLGIFPEGTRIIKGRVSDPMPGAAMIAHKTKAPIFYVRIKPKKGTFKLFTKTYVYVGDVVTVSELGVTNGKGDEYKAASTELMNRIYLLGEV